MNDRGAQEGPAGAAGGVDRVSTDESLPYRIDLWSMGSENFERTLARAASGHLARAIFSAAQTEFPGRRITLQRDTIIVADTQGIHTRDRNA